MMNNTLRQETTSVDADHSGHYTWISYNTGHIQGGSFMVIYGLWMMVNVYYSQCKAICEKTKYASAVTYPFFFCPNRFNCRRLPWEAIVKMALTSTGVIYHVYQLNSWTKEWVGLTRPAILQHISKFSAFLVSSVVDLLVHFRFPLPSAIDKLALAGAFCNELLLFAFHHDEIHRPYETAIHKPFTYVISGTCISLLLEIKLPQSVLASLSRAYTIILQGTWLWHSSYFMWFREYMKTDYRFLIMACFTFHAFVVFAITILLAPLIMFITVKYMFGKTSGKQSSRPLLAYAE